MLHQTHVIINLENIYRNLEQIKNLVSPRRKILLAVKSNGYGLGAIPVALMSERHSLVDWFGVTTVPEGIDLRTAGVRLPILKLSPTFQEEMFEAINNNLTLTVCDLSNIAIIQKICHSQHIKYPVHLKIDTGLGRFGVNPYEAPNLAVYIEKSCPNLLLEGIFTQMADGRSPQGTQFTEKQITIFRQTIDNIKTTIGRTPDLIHCANSSVIFNQTEDSWFSMVRIGQAAYGGCSWNKANNVHLNLSNGLISFCTRVSFLKKVSKGTNVGYRQDWTASDDCWIATLPVGYTDGFNRHFSNRGRVLINGESYPIVGIIGMNQCMANLGKETTVQVGDEVVLIGRSGNNIITVDEWVKILDSTQNEVICQINPHLPRIYLGFENLVGGGLAFS